MKTIIAGSRSIEDYAAVAEAVQESGFKITEVVNGCARGVDTYGEKWAEKNNVPVKKFPADWNKHGKSAGYKRNVQMSDYAEALVLVWDGISKGSGHMLNIAKSKGLKVYVKILEKQ